MSNYLSYQVYDQIFEELKFDKDPYLERVIWQGRCSNFRKRPNHQYFSLKDEKKLGYSGMVWAGVYQLWFELEEGMKINVIGRIQLLWAKWELFHCHWSWARWVEAMAIQFEQLSMQARRRLFQDRWKQALPQFQERSGSSPVKVGRDSR